MVRQQCQSEPAFLARVHLYAYDIITCIALLYLLWPSMINMMESP